MTPEQLDFRIGVSIALKLYDDVDGSTVEHLDNGASRYRITIRGQEVCIAVDQDPAVRNTDAFARELVKHARYVLEHGA